MLGMHLEVRQGAKGSYLHQRQQMETILCLRSRTQHTPNQSHIHLVEVKDCENTMSRSRLKSANQQDSVLSTSGGLQPKSAHTDGSIYLSGSV